MFTIIEKTKLAKDITRLVVSAPDIARKARAGQFVVTVSKEDSERIPLTIADTNSQKGEITLIFQEVGFSTRELAGLNPGEVIRHILGPLGEPTHIEKFGSVVCIGGGVGIAEMLPVARAMQQAGNRVIGIIGTRSKDMVILEKELNEVCAELFVTTNDGSYGKKGLVTDVLLDLLKVIEKSTHRPQGHGLASYSQSHTEYPELVYAVGPVMMMKAVSELTKGYNIKTLVSLNPVMVDATGMCGSCRVTVGGVVKFGCVDGPEFDGHQVDFEELQKRLGAFKEKEECANKQCVIK